MLKLEFPEEKHEKEYVRMLEEWKSFEATPTSPAVLFHGNSFSEFLENVRSQVNSIAEGSVSAHFYFLTEGETIHGGIQLRHHIDHPKLIENGGHVGYGIRPSSRWKGLAKEQLRLLLDKASEMELGKLLLCCYDDNMASARVIEANGGVFERFTEHEGKKARRYWITLN